jgi:asparagine synthase (glutamine-hydrolysing)
MCGIQITKTKLSNGISHRGIEHFNGSCYDWYYNFSSLPLSSFKTGLVQPVKTSIGYLFFNGEIFNYKEFGNYKSDLDYLVKLFNKGWTQINKEIYKWDGFWAICLVDIKGITFFTDPLGKKQLYYSKIGICSEIYPINTNQGFQEYEMGTDSTNFIGVQRAMPGCFYFYANNTNRPHSDSRYFKFNLRQTDLELDFYRLMENSILTRSVNSIGQISLLFSGGLDSSILAYHLTKLNIPFKAISIENEESQQAMKIADEIGFSINWVELDISKISNAVKSYSLDLDYGSLLPNYLLFEKSKQLGCPVSLSGDGADELFGGYKRNLDKDTQQYDIFTELPYYHLIRLDKTSMAHTVENRNPFLSRDLISYSLNLKWGERRNKQHLRDLYVNKIQNLTNDKKPLRYIKNKQENINLIKKQFNHEFKK